MRTSTRKDRDGRRGYTRIVGGVYGMPTVSRVTKDIDETYQCMFTGYSSVDE